MPDPTTDPDDDADLVAYLDGELDGPAAEAVEARLARDASARTRADALKKTFDLLDFLPRPDPSPHFTARTLTALLPAAAGDSPPPGTPVRGPSRVGRGLAWAAAGLVALGGGYLARANLDPPPAPAAVEEPTLADLRVIERLPLYLGADDLGFVRQLDAPDLFGPDPATTSFTLPVSSSPPASGRDRLIALFRGYPPARQQQLRQLDQQLADLPPGERDRLFGVLDGYAAWLDRLPDADRAEVLAAPNPGDRLEVVRQVRERQWRDGLTGPSKEQLKLVADPDERVQLIARWKQAEAGRRAEWAVARRQWDEFTRDPAARPWPFTDPALVEQVEEYVRTVFRADPAKFEPRAELPPGCRLTREELLDLKARYEATRSGYWLLYGACLLRLAERHPGLPEPGAGQPVVDHFGLPPDTVKEFKKLRLNVEVRRTNAAGKWPEYAVELALLAQRSGVVLPEPLGPCRPGEFTPPVEGFLIGTLVPVLTLPEADGLAKLEGKWPDYPRRLIELARRHDLPVPGVTLPGPPSRWAKLYAP